MTRLEKSQQVGVLVWGRNAANAAELLLPLVLVWLLGDPGDFGVLAVLLLIYKLSTVILVAGVPPSALYFLAGKSPEERHTLAGFITRLMVVLGSALGLMLVILGVFGRPVFLEIGASVAQLLGRPWDQDPKLLQALDYLPILAVYGVFDLPVRCLPNILIAEERARSAALFPLVRSSATLVCTIVPVILGYGTFGAVCGLSISGAIQFATHLGLLRYTYRGIGRGKRTLTVRSVLGHALPLGLTNIVNDLIRNLDMWLLIGLYVATAAEVAVYRAGSWQLPLITTIAYSTGAVYVAEFKALHHQGKGHEAIRIWRGLIGKVSLIVVPIAALFAVGAEEFVGMVFPAEYAGAAPVFRAYCFLTMARVSAYGAALIAAGRSKDVVNAALLTLGANVLISVPCVLLFGFVGPASGTALAIIPCTAIYCWFIGRAYGVKWRHTFPFVTYIKILAHVVVPCAAAVLFKLKVDWPDAGKFAVQGLIVLLGFFFLASSTGRITAEDRRFLVDWLTLKSIRSG